MWQQQHQMAYNSYPNANSYLQSNTPGKRPYPTTTYPGQGGAHIHNGFSRPTSQVMCRYFATGYCRLGEQCPFSHDMQNLLQNLVEMPMNPVPMGMQYEKFVRNFFIDFFMSNYSLFLLLSILP